MDGTSRKCEKYYWYYLPIDDDDEMNETVPNEDLDRPKPADVTPDGRQDK